MWIPNITLLQRDLLQQQGPWKSSPTTVSVVIVDRPRPRDHGGRGRTPRRHRRRRVLGGNGGSGGEQVLPLVASVGAAATQGMVCTDMAKKPWTRLRD